MTRAKPQGRKGPLRISQAGAEWLVIDFPSNKAARELMIGEMFVRAANHLIMLESPEQPRYAPFANLRQNDENDLDFRITTARGEKLMELAEFAPLHEHGPQFKNAPLQLDQVTKSDLLIALIRKKSMRQGGANRLLLIYVTEEAFRVDPVTIEIARRALAQEHPGFERVYYVSPHDSTTGSVDEIFPGKPHHICGGWTDEQLQLRRTNFMHPTEMVAVSELCGTMWVPLYGECKFTFRYLTAPDIRDARRTGT